MMRCHPTDPDTQLNTEHFATSVKRAGEQLNEFAEAHINTMVILGTGLGDMVECQDQPTLAYNQIHGMHGTSVMSHRGNITLARDTNGVTAFCHGRLHLYEGYSAQQVAFLTYAMAAAGASKLIVTNAAGALNPEYHPGEIMLIEDHLNTTGHNPIVGQADDLGMRFTDMSDAYARDQIQRILKICNEQNLAVRQGIYAGVLGPSLETSAERRMLRSFGADAVGMSTVMEVIAANHCAMQVIGLSAITNRATGDEGQQPDSIDEILEHAAHAGTKIKKIIAAILA